MHVRNDAICDDQKYKVMLTILEIASYRAGVVYDWSEISRSIEGDTSYTVSVMIKDVLNS